MAYLYPTDSPRVLAHRGLTIDAFGAAIDENTIPAFARALEVGATHLESDIQVTSDGIPVLFHDDDLARVAGTANRISELPYADLRTIQLQHGGTIPSLEEALRAFPDALFNLDFKTEAAVTFGSAVLARENAAKRIMVASFSDRRRLAAQGLLEGTVSSAGSASAVACRFLSALGIQNPARALRGATAIQVPVSSAGIVFANPSMIQKLTAHGVETHFWTINDPTQMLQLVALGAAGVVTDRADLAAEVLL